jgi:hypothetical protein
MTRTTASIFALVVGAALGIGACGDESGGGATNQGGSDGQGGGFGCLVGSEHPLPRGETMGIVDAKRSRLVFFGGDTGVPQNCNPAPRPVGELWTYDITCKNFEQVQGATGPGPRARGVAVHDPDGDRMILFAGRYREATSGPYTIYNDVWALDLETFSWQPITTTGTAPSARSSTAAAFNPTTREMIVFGGNESTDGASFIPLADAWALNVDTGAWRNIVPAGPTPEPRLFHAVALDAATGRLYVHAGGDANAFLGPFLGDLWSLDTASGAWTEEHPGGAGAPDARIHASIFFDAGKGRVLLFAGHDGAVGNQPGNQNDTWSFDPATKVWSNIVPPEVVVTQPPAFCLFPPDFTNPNLAVPDRRSSYLGGLDAAAGKLFIYGGKTDCGIIDDVWSYDLAGDAWSREIESTIGEACLRGDVPSQCTTLCI